MLHASSQQAALNDWIKTASGLICAKAKLTKVLVETNPIEPPSALAAGTGADANGQKGDL